MLSQLLFNVSTKTDKTGKLLIGSFQKLFAPVAISAVTVTEAAVPVTRHSKVEAEILFTSQKTTNSL